MRRVPTELLTMMFNSAILAIKRKDDKRLKIACQVLDMDESGEAAPPKEVVVNGMPDEAVGPYGSSYGITLPPITSRVVQGMRRSGISPKNDYLRVRAQVTPEYSIGRFVNDLKKAQFQVK